MIKKASEMINEVRNQMRGGKGSVELIHIMKPEELKGRTRMLAKITIPPGCSIGMHQHVNEEEIYYILRGKGVVNDDGQNKEVNVGDAVITRDGASHSIESIGDEPLEMMAVILLY